MNDERLLVSAINISEGRRGQVLDEIAGAVRGDAKVLDVHSDPDHNRAVLTVAARPSKFESAIFSIAASCIKLIDLRGHDGAHPRLGSIDVVPVVPARGASMRDAVDVAKAVAARLAKDLDLPCFMYEMASETQRALPDIRRFAFGSLPPDYGPEDPHPTAGAASIGARGPLVAFNVELETIDIEVARRIAKAVRSGNKGIRSLAFALGGRNCVQVSMNLIDPLVTTPARAFKEVERVALAEQVSIRSAEIVGLAPRDALVDLVVSRLNQPHHPELEKALERAFGKKEA